jgi:hypothetical protein
MSRTAKTDPNVRNRVYSGKFTGEETAGAPLDQPMKPSGDPLKVTYDEGLRWVEGTKYGLDVNKADKIRLNPAAMRFKTHGKNPGDDDQSKGSI